MILVCARLGRARHWQNAIPKPASIESVRIEQRRDLLSGIEHPAFNSILRYADDVGDFNRLLMIVSRFTFNKSRVRTLPTAV